MAVEKKIGAQVSMNLLAYLPKRLSRAKAKIPPHPRTAGTTPQAVVPRDPIPLPADLKRRLNAVRRNFRVVGIGTGVAMLAAAVSLLFLVQCLCDWWFDLPWAARAGFFLVDIFLLVSIYRRHLDGPLRTRLTLEETALRIEKKWPHLQQSVIAAVELTAGHFHSTRGSRQLVDLTLEQARERTSALKLHEVVPTRALRRWSVAAALAIAVTGTFAVVAWPSSLALLERLFLLNVPLPTKTIVVPITHDLIVPVGSDVELSAQATGIIPAHGRVTIAYPGAASEEFPVSGTADKPATFSLTLRNVQSDFKYRFFLNDGRGTEFTVSPRTPPTVTIIECEQIFPGYTGIPPQKLAPTELSLLAGSHLRVHAISAGPLKSATLVLQGLSRTIEATLDASGTQLDADLPIPAKDLSGFSIHLVDVAGMSSTDETVYPIVLLPDNPPVVKILEPADDRETITLRAEPVIVFDASDDYGLTQLTIHYQVAAPVVVGEQNNQPASEVQNIPIKIKPAQEGHRYEYVVDVAAQNPPWQEGYTVNYWIEAVDNNTVTGPGVTRTDHRQFEIISVEAKEAEILERLKQNADEIDAVSGKQQKINDDVGEAIPQK
jgi:hypothetical protein